MNIYTNAAETGSSLMANQLRDEVGVRMLRNAQDLVTTQMAGILESLPQAQSASLPGVGANIDVTA